MDTAYSAEDLAFREEVKAFFSEAYTPELQKRLRSPDYKNAIEEWQRKLYDQGWVAPNWPVEFGGTGWTATQKYIYETERSLAGIPNVVPFGLVMVANVIMAYGTDEQKAYFLPRILKSEDWWCQGYSEPGSGSDLAGLQTKAEDMGDHYLVNGQKVWTSYANKADWIFCLVRTDTSVKHEGISFLLIDMETEGVEARPIKLISGSSPFCETFLTDVKVPKENLVGELNKGWTIAKRLLEHERAMISEMNMGAGEASLGGMEELAKEVFGELDGMIAHPTLRDTVTRHKMDEEAFGLTLRRTGELAKAGHGIGAEASIFKYYGSEMNKRRFEILLELLGTDALTTEGEGHNQDVMSISPQWLRSKGNSIEGGTTEVQLNIIAKRVLDLPEGGQA